MHQGDRRQGRLTLHVPVSVSFSFRLFHLTYYLPTCLPTGRTRAHFLFCHPQDFSHDSVLQKKVGLSTRPPYAHTTIQFDEITKS